MAATLPRRILGVASVVIVGAIAVAALLPSQPDGLVGGPLGIATAVVAGVALVTAWIAAIWHAAATTPWRAAAPKWLVIAILVFGTGVAGVLYYVLFAHWQRDIVELPTRAA